MDLERYKELINGCRDSYPLNSGAHVEVLKDGYAEVTMPITKEMLNLHGIVHGGLSFALADFASGMASRTTGVKSVTLSADVSYLSPVRIEAGTMRAVAQAKKVGRSTGIYLCDVFDGNGKLCLTTKCTFFFLGEPVEFQDRKGETASEKAE